MSDLPAIAGGKPVRKKPLPLAEPDINKNDRIAIEKVLNSKNLTGDLLVTEFEERFAHYIGTRYAVAVSSGAAGIHIALMAAALGHEEEVITSALVHPSTPSAIIHQKGVHTFADIDPVTYNINPEEIKNKLSLRTMVLMPVHFAGRPCDLEAIMKIANENKLEVIEDASHALGAEYMGKKIGTLSPITVFSFDDSQGLCTGRGGMVVTDSEELYFWLSMFRNGGIVKEPGKLSRQEGPWYFEMQDLGYNYQMGEMNAALGISQLERVEWFTQRREEIAHMYNNAFIELEQVNLPVPFSKGRHSWYYYTLTLRYENLKASRLEIYNALRAENIEVDVYCMPAFMHPYFLWAGHPDVCTLEGSLCPNAENLYNKILTLPLFPSMTQQDVDDVINAVHKVIKYYAL